MKWRKAQFGRSAWETRTQRFRFSIRKRPAGGRGWSLWVAEGDEPWRRAGAFDTLREGKAFAQTMAGRA